LRKHQGNEDLNSVIKADVQVFSDLLKDNGICAVDVPIDLQGLNEYSGNKNYVWEATKRSIDHELGALPPIADRIGAVVARMRLIMNYYPDSLGKAIFETYPAGSLALMKENQQYKEGKAIWDGSLWKPSADGKEKANEGLANVLNSLNFVCVLEGIVLTDDQFDAILSAIPLLSEPWLTGSLLLNHPYLKKRGIKDVPTGYILCERRFWTKIEIQ